MGRWLLGEPAVADFFCIAALPEIKNILLAGIRICRYHIICEFRFPAFSGTGVSKSSLRFAYLTRRPKLTNLRHW